MPDVKRSPRDHAVISALFPGFLAAGAALAIAPILLHLLARRPPDRQPLPTARFLRNDARTFLRLQRRPTDLVVLAMRVLFAVSLGAAFAGMTWTSPRDGRGHIVLLDAGAAAQADWDAAREIAAAELTATSSTGAGQSVVLAYGLDDGSRLVAAADLSALSRGTRPATAEDGLRALRSAALSETRWQRATVTWVTRPSWRAWSPGVGLLRPVLWPGHVALSLVPDAPASSGSGSEALLGAEPTAVPSAVDSVSMLVARVTDGSEDDPLWRALTALGVTVVAAGVPGRPDWIFVEAPSREVLAGLLDEARRGATVIASGRLSSGADIPWIPGGATESDRGGVILETGVTLYPATAAGGTPAPGARTVAVFENATPAATAVTLGEGCVVYFAASIYDPALSGGPEYPNLVDALGRACADDMGLDAPLDRGGLHALERSDLPDGVDLTAMAGEEGRPLGRWLILLALLLLTAEIGLTRVRRS